MMPARSWAAGLRPRAGWRKCIDWIYWTSMRREPLYSVTQRHKKLERVSSLHRLARSLSSNHVGRIRGLKWGFASTRFQVSTSPLLILHLHPMSCIINVATLDLRTHRDMPSVMPFSSLLPIHRSYKAVFLTVREINTTLLKFSFEILISHKIER